MIFALNTGLKSKKRQIRYLPLAQAFLFFGEGDIKKTRELNLKIFIIKFFIKKESILL